MIKAIFFDFGRVLMNIEDDGYYEANDRKFGLPEGKTAKFIIEFNKQIDVGEGKTLEEFWRIKKDEMGRMTSSDMEDFSRIVEGTRKPNAPFIEFIEQNLFNKYRLAVLSNFTEDLTDIIAEYGIAHLFEDVFISQVLRMRKPDPRIYQYALEKFDVLPEESLFIDDKEENVLSAKNIGMNGFVFVNTEDAIDQIKKMTL